MFLFRLEIHLESKNKLPIHPEELESPEEKKVRYRSIRIGQVALLIFAIGFSIVLTGVYPYMTQVSHPTYRKCVSRWSYFCRLSIFRDYLKQYKYIFIPLQQNNNNI